MSKSQFMKASTALITSALAMVAATQADAQVLTGPIGGSGSTGGSGNCPTVNGIPCTPPVIIAPPTTTPTTPITNNNSATAIAAAAAAAEAQAHANATGGAGGAGGAVNIAPGAITANPTATGGAATIEKGAVAVTANPTATSTSEGGAATIEKGAVTATQTATSTSQGGQGGSVAPGAVQIDNHSVYKAAAYAASMGVNASTECQVGTAVTFGVVAATGGLSRVKSDKGCRTDVTENNAALVSIQSQDPEQVGLGYTILAQKSTVVAGALEAPSIATRFRGYSQPPSVNVNNNANAGGAPLPASAVGVDAAGRLQPPLLGGSAAPSPRGHQ